MVLQQDAAGRCFPKILPHLVLTLRNQRPIDLRSALVFEHFLVVQPMFNVISLYHETRPVPVARTVDTLVSLGEAEVARRDQVVDEIVALVQPPVGVFLDLLCQFSGPRPRSTPPKAARRSRRETW